MCFDFQSFIFELSVLKNTNQKQIIMNKQKIYRIFLLVLILIISSCKTHQNLKSKEYNFYKYEHYTIPDKESTTKGLSAFVENEITEPVDCNSKPSIDEVRLGQWTYTDKFYTLSQAYKIGIPIANADFTKNITIYVRDYKRIKSCVANDGITEINYGQIIRTVIEIENFDSSVGVDLASIAASGTLNGKKQSFYLYKDGFYNPKIDAIIGTVSGKVFDVENYALYQNVMSELIKLLADNETTFAVNKIGIVKNEETNEFLSESPIICYTLYQISKGKTCNEIKNNFTNSPKSVELVNKTFNSLQLNCNDIEITEETKLKAKRLMQGLRIK